MVNICKKMTHPKVTDSYTMYTRRSQTYASFHYYHFNFFKCH